MAFRALSARAPNIRDGTPSLSVQRKGRLAWNRGMHDALGRPERVEILFDDQAMVLGLRGATGGANTFAVRRAERQNTWSVSALAALRGGAPYLEVKTAYRARAVPLGDGIMGISVAPLAEGERDRQAERKGKG